MKNYHLIAIGGSIMHNLALELKSQGHSVTGSDDKIFDPARTNLMHAGILPDEEGWFPEKLAKRPDVILGMHARGDNPELLEAKRLNLNVYSFPEFVALNTKEAKRVVVAGSHGKTTTTSMILHVLNKLSVESDFLVGAQLPGFERMVRLRNAPIAVFEGDEYLSSALDLRPKFVHYKPQIAVITGIAWDHMNVFPTFEKYIQAFLDFIQSLPEAAILVLCGHDEKLKGIAHLIREDIRTIWYYALPARADGFGLVLDFKDKSFKLPFFGDYNLQNMAAAYKVCKLLGVDSIHFFEAMQSFTGAAKRLEIQYQDDDLVVYRDFAHAPSKVKAAVQALRKQFPDKKLGVVLELHTYSSLNKAFIPQYAQSLNDTNEAILVYDPEAMALKKMPELDKQALFDAFQCPWIQISSSLHELKSSLQQFSSKNAIWVFMTSGSMFGFDIQEFLSSNVPKTK
jgi:UDP-N-acetylmuramate: L-alanyl-gamma-D-glutamyl-meso-diaminopimelate ligase